MYFIIDTIGRDVIMELVGFMIILRLDCCSSPHYGIPIVLYGIPTDNELHMQADISKFTRNINFRINQAATLVTCAEKVLFNFFTFLSLPNLSPSASSKLSLLSCVSR